MITGSGFIFALIPMWGLILDLILGETSKYHPLVGFGNLAALIESYTRRVALNGRVQGALAWILVIIPIIGLCSLLLSLIKQSLIIYFIVNLLILYFTLGCKSLLQHTQAIFNARDNIDSAREKVAMIVSRNAQKMDEPEIASAAIESALENGNDAIIGALFWFTLLGAPGALLFRLANTLDAMWGYKNERYLEFGYFAAKMDDILGWFPARLSGILYSVCGNYRQGFYCWETQAKLCKSPNGGVAMCAGAGALNITIGGPAYYDGKLQDKIYMGMGEKAKLSHIPKANRLVLLSASLCAVLLPLLKVVAL